MLIEFTVGNYLSYKKQVTFSMAASHIKEHQASNVINLQEEDNLLKTAVIYGANASGKSNLFKAMRFMSDFVKTSSSEAQINDKIRIKKFRLSNETEKQPSFFEIIFIHNSTRYRYGFEVDEDRVHNEWLFFVPNVKEIPLFVRAKNVYNIHDQFSEGKDLEKNTRENALFLSVVAQLNGEISKGIISWFGNFTVISGTTLLQQNPRLKNAPLNISTKFIKNEDDKKTVLKLLQSADLGIDDISIEEKTFIYPDEKELTFTRTSVNTVHKKYDSENNVIGNQTFSMDQDESAGTRKLFAMSALIINALRKKGILVVDELDSSMHPLITKLIIKLFQSEDFRAQLVLITHDTSLLDKAFFRRDQIWFTEKNKYGATDLYSLLDYKVRNDASYGKDYIKGRYGAIPFVGDFESLIKI